MQNYIEILRQNGLLREINTPCSTELEIAHLSYLEVKKSRSKALLFTKPVDKNAKPFNYPVLTNLFGSQDALELIFGKNPDSIADEISKLLMPKKPITIKEKINLF